MPEQREQSGFSLIELMVVIVLLAIALGLGTASFRQTMANSHMASAVNALVSSLHAARSEAITRSTTVTICASTDGERCDADASFGSGWLIFADEDSNGRRDEGEALLQAHGPLSGGLAERLAATGREGDTGYISFTALGQLPPPGTPLADSLTHIQLCDHRGDRDTGDGVAAGRWIEVLPTGWPQIHRLRERVQAGPLGGC